MTKFWVILNTKCIYNFYPIKKNEGKEKIYWQ